MYVGHEQLAPLIEIGLEHDGAAHDIRVALYHLATVGLHAFRLVEMSQQVLIGVLCGLLDAQQHIVDLLHRSGKGFLGILDGFLFQCLPREIEHHA